MLGRKAFTPKLFYEFSLEAQIPDNHLLRRVAAVVDFAFVRRLTARCSSRHIATVTFRIADINDVIFNTVGVVIGYWAFTIVAKWVCATGLKWPFLPAE